LALKNGWLNDYTWFEKIKGKWSYETCLEEAKKYESVRKFQKGSSGAFSAAYKNGWINNYTWLHRQ
jgi:hypothetical protein